MGVLLTIVLLGLAVVSQPADLPGAVSVRQATVLHAHNAQTVSKTIALPHNWDDESPTWVGVARYEMAWPQDLAGNSPYALLPTTSAPSTDYAIYLPRIGARFRVFLNDQAISTEYWDRAGYVDTSVVPHLVLLPSQQLRYPLQDNRLSIEVQGQLLRKSGLSELVIGPRAIIEARYDKIYAWQIIATWMVAACSALIGLLSGLMWLQNRERMFGLLALACITWVVRLSLTPLVHPPMSFEVWFYLHKLSFTVYCGLVYLFLAEIFNFRQRWGRKLVFVLLAVGPVWLAVTTLSGSYQLYRVWTGIVATTSFVTLLQMFARARWGMDKTQRLMVVVGLVTLITGLRDFAVVQLGLPGDADIRWMTLGSLAFMLTLVWVLGQRTAGYVRQINQLNLNLEQRVADKENQLRQAFDQLRASEHRQVLEAERQRLTRDMHDGLGSQLIQTLNVIRAQTAPANATVVAMLGHALEELRMTLDSLEPMEGDLPAILGTLRQRIAPALDAAGIELDWRVQEVPSVQVDGQTLESRGVMHLFRFLQEVFANAIKHSGANKIQVATSTRTDAAGKHYVLLAVSDNGKGMGTGLRDGGRGMQNLQARALALGAELTVGAASQQTSGTRIALEFVANSLSDQPRR
jgi:signal transduction histidine kinase